MLGEETAHSLPPSPPHPPTAWCPELRGPRKSSNLGQAAGHTRGRVVGRTTRSFLETLPTPKWTLPIDRDQKLGSVGCQCPQDNTCAMWPTIQGAGKCQERKAKQQSKKTRRAGNQDPATRKEGTSAVGGRGPGEEQRRRADGGWGTEGEGCTAVVSQWPSTHISWLVATAARTAAFSFSPSPPCPAPT